MSPALGILVGVSFALYLRAIYLGPEWQVYLFKPLTTILILSGAVLTARRQPKGSERARYGRLICVGLLCSLAGDVLLMLPRDRFVAGLGAFLLAHVCYIGAFSRPAGPRAAACVRGSLGYSLGVPCEPMLPGSPRSTACPD